MSGESGPILPSGYSAKQCVRRVNNEWDWTIETAPSRWARVGQRDLNTPPRSVEGLDAESITAFPAASRTQLWVGESCLRGAVFIPHRQQCFSRRNERGRGACSCGASATYGLSGARRIAMPKYSSDFPGLSLSAPLDLDAGDLVPADPAPREEAEQLLDRRDAGVPRQGKRTRSGSGVYLHTGPCWSTWSDRDMAT